MTESTRGSTVLAWIASLRVTPPWFILLTLIVYLGLFATLNLVFTPADYLKSFCSATGYLIHPTQMNYIPGFVIFGVLFFLVARLRCHDLGLILNRLPVAIVWTLATWVAAQVFVVLINYGDVAIDPAWRSEWTVSIGSLVTGQLLGNALTEEVFWRAFVLSQLVLWFQHRWKCRTGVAVTWAILITCVLFALSHIPIDLANSQSVQQMLVGQAGRFAAGLVLAWIFLLSNNLFLAIGLHALVDDPVSLFEGGNEEATQAFLVFAPLLVLCVMALNRRRASRRTDAKAA